jgi:hypothetical protein
MIAQNKDYQLYNREQGDKKLTKKILNLAKNNILKI